MTGTDVVPAGPPSDEAFDRLRRRVLWALPTGLYVVGSRADERRNLMTCSWVMQVAMSPKLVAISVESDSLTRELVEAGGSFSVSLLARSDRALVRRFVKPVRDVEVSTDGAATAMQGEDVSEVAGGLPVLSVAIGWLACSVVAVHSWDGDLPKDVTSDSSSHVLIVGQVVDAGEQPRLSAPVGEEDGVLSMADTRMSYGG